MHATHRACSPSRRGRWALCPDDTPGAPLARVVIFYREAVLSAGRRKILAQAKALITRMSLCPSSACKCVGASLPPKSILCCAIVQRTCPAVVENGNARAMHALTPLLEHGAFTVRPDALVGSAKSDWLVTRTSMSVWRGRSVRGLPPTASTRHRAVSRPRTRLCKWSKKTAPSIADVL